MGKKSRKYILFALPILLFTVMAYYSFEVLLARQRTEQIARTYLAQAAIRKENLSTRQLEILLKVQDPNFYGHHGVDFHTAGTGWTTITQSLAKRFYFRQFRQGLPKIKQTMCARFALDPLVSKDQQITIFLNEMYFGNEQTGIADAAAYYFSKKVYELTEDEYISLIASIMSPATMNIKSNPEANAQRVRRIKKMLSGEYKPTHLLDIDYSKQNSLQ